MPDDLDLVIVGGGDSALDEAAVLAASVGRLLWQRLYGSGGGNLVDVDLVAEAGAHAYAFDFGRHLTGLFKLQFEPRRIHRLTVEADVGELAVSEVHVQAMHFLN
jgi:hypothetical protein